MRKPNIVLIMSDQYNFNYFQGLCNNLIDTKNIDLVSKEGCLFSSAYTPSPLYSSAFMSIYSGRYLSRYIELVECDKSMDETILLTKNLRKSGYYTATTDIRDIALHAENMGFTKNIAHDTSWKIDEEGYKYSQYIEWLKAKSNGNLRKDVIDYFHADKKPNTSADINQLVMTKTNIPEESHEITAIANEAIGFIKQYKDDAPFFLNVSFIDSYNPWQIPDKWNHLYNPDKIKLPKYFYVNMQDNPIFDFLYAKEICINREVLSEQDYRQIIAAYFGKVAMVDHYIGIILECLKKQGFWDNTVIIFTSSHGDHLGEYGIFFGGDMYESSVRVPLIIKPVKSDRKTRRYDGIVNTIDIYGTILEIAGCFDWKDKNTESGSLLNLLDTNVLSCGPIKNETFSINCTNPEYNLAMYIREGYKIIRLIHESDPNPLYELYDLHQKPTEVINLFNKRAYKNERDRMVETIENWYEKQTDNIKALNKINK